MDRKKYLAPFAALLAALLWIALATVGGPLNRFDVAAIDALAAERLSHPFFTYAGIWISFAGGAPGTVGLSLLAAAFLIWRKRISSAATLLAITLGGRLLVEVLKAAIARPRPDLDLQAVTVRSLSFPSGHAANSMIAFVTIALLCAPERHRRAATTAAIVASLIVGATRPLLGVHWPSDVLAGWIFGLLWVAGGVMAARKLGQARSV